MQTRFLIFLGALSLCGQGVSAETLSEALQAAQSTNPQLGVQRVQQEISQEQLRSAQGARLPNVEVTSSADVTRIDTDGPVFANINVGRIETLQAQLQATQPVYTGGRITAGIRQARAGISASDALLEAATQDTFLQTITTYVDVRQNREAVEIQKSSVDLLTEQLKAARDRFEVGEITRTDVALAEARLEGALANLAASEAQVEASEALYESIVGFPAGDLIPPPPVGSLPDTFDLALAQAIENNPNIKAAQFNELAAEQAVRTARADLLPELNFIARAGVQQQFNEDVTFPEITNTSLAALAQARIPIYQGGVARAQVRAAKLEAAQAKLDIETERRSTISDVSQFWYAYKSALASIGASERQVTAAQVAYEGGVEELAVGVRTTLDVLDQEQDLLEARLTLSQSQRDAYVAAHQLLRAMGVLTADRFGL
ncbi:MAG: TolC family outer membrane protein [Pseudomonadota bacterium]